MIFAIKAAIVDPTAETFLFHEQKTMDGGKHIAIGDIRLGDNSGPTAPV